MEGKQKIELPIEVLNAWKDLQRIDCYLRIKELEKSGCGPMPTLSGKMRNENNILKGGPSDRVFEIVRRYYEDIPSEEDINNYDSVVESIKQGL